MSSEFSWNNNWYYLIISIINSIGFILNCLNISVFLNPKMKNITFKYMLNTSIADVIYLGCLSYNVIKYCTDHPLYNTYYTQFFIAYENDYFTSCLAIFVIFTDIIISIERYLILKKKIYLKNTSYRWITSILLVVSFIYYLPIIFFRDIIVLKTNTTSLNSTSTQIKYINVKNALGLSDFGRIMPIVLTVVRLFLGIVVLTVVNSLNAYELRKRILEKKKRKLTLDFNIFSLLIINIILVQENPVKMPINQAKSNSTSSDLATITSKNTNNMVKSDAPKKSSNSSVRSITLISIHTCLLYLFGQLPYFASYIMSFIVTTSASWFHTYQYITACILMLTHGLTFVIYFKYNKMYRQILISYFKIFKCNK